MVDLKTQDNYIETENRRFSYRKEIVFSCDLLTGKRKNVFETELCHDHTTPFEKLCLCILRFPAAHGWCAFYGYCTIGAGKSKSLRRAEV